MEPSTRLDYILFQLTPTRTRCDLVIFSGKHNEKLAYGLLDPFISHLRSAKDQIAKGGYSVTLRPPTSTVNATWFTKLTVLRFVRFVSSPEVIERVVTIEIEIQQIENSIHSYEASNAEADGNLKSANSTKNKVESSGTIDCEEQESSKDRLQRVLDTRKAVLRKEQAMAYARALAAGFEIENLDDLLAFSDAFGAARLRDACINFIELWKKKNQDRLWMDEIAAMQACIQPQLSYVATPGIILTGDEDPDQKMSNGRPDSTGSGGSSEAAPGQMASNDGKHQMPIPWTNQIPPYMHNFQGPMYQQGPPYQGYGFPGMPPYFPGHMQWPHNMRDAAHGSDRELDDTRSYRSSSRRKERKSKARAENGNEDEESEPSDSSGESESSQERRSRKRHGKKSSRKVVIRNINYITSKKNGRDSEETPSDEDGLDEDSLRQEVEEAVGSLGKHHKTTRRRKHDSKNDELSDQDTKSELHKKDEGARGNGNWDALQDLLMREESTNNEPRSIQIEEQTLFASKHEAEGNVKQKAIAPDAFLPPVRDTGNESRFSKVPFETIESGGRAGKGATGDEFLISDRDVTSDYYSRVMPSDYGSSIIKGRDSDDWITGLPSDRSGSQGASINVGMIDGEYAVSSNGRTEQSKRDLFDDSVMIQPMMVQDRSQGYLPSFDTDIVADIAGAPTPGEGNNTKEPINIHEPEELYMVLDRDNSADHVMSSWSVDMNLEESISLSEAQNKKTPVGNGAEAKLQNGKGMKKAPTRDARSRSLTGPLGRSKPDLMEKNRRSTFGSKTIPRSNLKDEDNRKRMEEIALERKRRIAERSAARGQSLASSKTNPNLTRTRSASATGRSKDPSSTQEPARASKSVLRSSTIERLATAKTYKQEESRTQTKSNLPKKVVGANVNKPKPLEKKSGSEKLNKTTDVSSASAPDNSVGKESVSTSHPSDLITQQIKSTTPDTTYPTDLITEQSKIKIASEDVKDLHIAPSVSNGVQKPLEHKSSADERSYTKHSVDTSKTAEDDKVVNTLKPKEEEVDLKQNVPLSKAKPEPIFEPVQVSPIKQLGLNSVVEEKGSSTKEIFPEASSELPKFESSTPPSIHEDPVTLRKKWNDAASDSPKSAKGFRKLLMFSRRKVEYA